MSLLGWFQSLWKKESGKYKYVSIDAAHVLSDDEGTPADESFTAGNHYFRLWLVEMFLKNDREWFTSWHPAVHAAINFRFGDSDELVTRVAGQTLLPSLDTQNLNRVVGLNYQMTPLVPFNGGVIELSAGLLAIAGKNEVKSFLKVLGDFSNLLMVPQLSTALAIATPLANGLAELVGATENKLTLGLHQTWTGGSGGAAQLRAGYFAVILADDNQLEDRKLWVEKGRLKYGDTLAAARPLSGYHYMLFRLERRSERDDWDSLTAIQEPYDKAIEMLRVGNAVQADAYIRTAKAAAFTAKELTRNVDQRRVVKQLELRYAEAQEALQQNAFDEASATGLGSVMQGAMPASEAASLGTLLPEDVGLEGFPVLEISEEPGRKVSAKPPPRNPRSGIGAYDATKNVELLGVSGEVEESSDMGDEELAPHFYFALEGKAAKGDAVQFGTDVDLIFNFAVPPVSVLALMRGEGLERVRRSDADLGISVIPKGFSFRDADADWYKVASFRGGNLKEPVRFLLRARDEEQKKSAQAEDAADDPNSLPVLKTGFHIIFDMNGVKLYDFPIPVRLVRSLDEVGEAATRRPLMLDLDKCVRQAMKAVTTIEKAMDVIQFSGLSSSGTTEASEPSPASESSSVSEDAQ